MGSLPRGDDPPQGARRLGRINRMNQMNEYRSLGLCRDRKNAWHILENRENHYYGFVDRSDQWMTLYPMKGTYGAGVKKKTISMKEIRF